MASCVTIVGWWRDPPTKCPTIGHNYLLANAGQVSGKPSAGQLRVLAAGDRARCRAKRPVRARGTAGTAHRTPGTIIVPAREVLGGSASKLNPSALDYRGQA